MRYLYCFLFCYNLLWLSRLTSVALSFHICKKTNARFTEVQVLSKLYNIVWFMIELWCCILIILPRVSSGLELATQSALCGTATLASGSDLENAEPGSVSTKWIRICMIRRFPGDSYAHSNLRNIGVDSSSSLWLWFYNRLRAYLNWRSLKVSSPRETPADD